MKGWHINNVVILLSSISRKYSNEFVPIMSKKMSYVPRHLRCGIARGSVCSVGGGKDYVGPCINVASRLQKLSGLSFCFALKGIDFFESRISRATRARYLAKTVEIRGIGPDERVGIKKSEYQRLGKKDQSLFKNP